jgi:hypothetical protein
MSRLIRGVLAITLFVIISGGILFGGPLASGGFWLTSRASSDRTPVTLPWMQPYHKGGIDLATGLYVRTDQDLIVQTGDLPNRRQTLLPHDGFRIARIRRRRDAQRRVVPPLRIRGCPVG